MIPAGESLDYHHVHERAWVTALDGEVGITAGAGAAVVGGPGQHGPAGWSLQEPGDLRRGHAGERGGELDEVV
jgi:hypothetical protein